MHAKHSLILPVTLFATTLAGAARADVITDWNQVAATAILTDKIGPNPATRIFAITHAAAHDAVASIVPKYKPYLGKLQTKGGESPEAAAAQAAYRVLVQLIPDQKAAFDAALATSLGAVPDGAAKDGGIQVGTASADALLAARATDGSAATVSYPGGTNVGQWRPTPPNQAAAVEPQWATVTPFALSKPEQFRPGAPPALTAAEYATAFNEVKDIGAKTSATRTAEQTEIAQFWVQPTHAPFNAIARKVAVSKSLALAESARLFALLNLALADSRIAAWDAKYTYGFWRPITAVADAANDGNAATAADAAWEPLIATPAHPEYVSGHSTTGAAGATVLKLVFGDNVSFSLGSDSLPNVTRSFTSFSQAAAENGQSRIYGGIHYQFSNAAGQTLGAAVAQHVFDTQLGAVDEQPDGGASDGGTTGSGGGSTSSTSSTGSTTGTGGSDGGATESGGCSAAPPSGSLSAWGAVTALALVGAMRLRRRRSTARRSSI